MFLLAASLIDVDEKSIPDSITIPGTLFGLTLVRRTAFLVEIGVLLDVFVAVFIMGIVVFHINREFDSISAANLVELRES